VKSIHAAARKFPKKGAGKRHSPFALSLPCDTAHIFVRKFGITWFSVLIVAILPMNTYDSHHLQGATWLDWRKQKKRPK
jgi:hypothetical protein